MASAAFSGQRPHPFVTDTPGRGPGDRTRGSLVLTDALGPCEQGKRPFLFLGQPQGHRRNGK